MIREWGGVKIGGIEGIGKEELEIWGFDFGKERNSKRKMHVDLGLG